MFQQKEVHYICIIVYFVDGSLTNLTDCFVGRSDLWLNVQNQRYQIVSIKIVLFDLLSYINDQYHFILMKAENKITYSNETILSNNCLIPKICHQIIITTSTF
jgi:hypothetical protein